MYRQLFSPYKIGNLEIKNRIVMPAMMFDHGQFDGTPTTQMTDYYVERAKGGVGLIISEITRVYDCNGAGSLAQLGISHHYQIKPLAELVEKIHQNDCKFFLQLHHAGMQAEPLTIGTIGLSIFLQKIWPGYKNFFYKLTPFALKLSKKGFVRRVVGPSKTKRCSFTNARMRALSKREIHQIQKAFIKGALRAQKAGCDGIELHASHGYLIQQFLSPRTNQRKDEYGGSFENRLRFLVEILTAIKKECGQDFPVSVRLTVDECYKEINQEGVGYTLEEGVKMAQAIEKAGADVLNISSATYETMNYWLEPTSFDVGWRKYLAQAVKEKVKIPVIAANVIRTPEQAEQQLNEGTQDFIAIGRPLIADPYWPAKAKKGQTKQINKCIGCLYCFESMLKNAYQGKAGECAVNPLMGHEADFPKIKKDGNQKKILIVGAGPAGLMSAKILAYRNFNVTIVEKEKSAGGQTRLASIPPKKEKLNWINLDYEQQAKASGVKIIYQKKVDQKYITKFNPYAIIVATGAQALKPTTIKGIEKKNVFTIIEILAQQVKIKNKKIALIGSGMTGLETATFLLKDKNQIKIIEMAQTIAPQVTYKPQKDNILPKLLKAGTKFYLNSQLTEILDDGIIIKNLKEKKSQKIAADIVVLAIGVLPENKLYKEIKDLHQNVYLIGDASTPGRIADATRDAYNLAKDLN